MCVVNTQDAGVNRSEPADIFSPHLSLGEIQIGIRAGRYVQGKFQPSRENCLEAFVNVYDSDEQVCATLRRYAPAPPLCYTPAINCKITATFNK